MKEQTKSKKCNAKCMMCKNRDKQTNFCKEKNEDCTSINIDFSKCKSYLIDDKLSMF